MFVVESRTPGITYLPSGSFVSRKTIHSCAWRPFDAISIMPAGLAFKMMSMMSLSSTSVVRGISPLPQQMWMRAASAGMFASA